MKVLLAVDDSAPSEAAIATLERRPWPAGTQVRVLTVVAPLLGATVPGVPIAGSEAALPAGFSEARKYQLEAAQAFVERVLERLAGSALQLESSVREGSPGAEIVDDADSWPADLIVLGSHGHSAMRRLLVGSVAHYVLNHAHCSIEVARVSRAG